MSSRVGPAASSAEERQAFVEHYAKLFEGDVKSFSQVVEMELTFSREHVGDGE